MVKYRTALAGLTAAFVVMGGGIAAGASTGEAASPSPKAPRAERDERGGCTLGQCGRIRISKASHKSVKIANNWCGSRGCGDKRWLRPGQDSADYSKFKDTDAVYVPENCLLPRPGSVSWRHGWHRMHNTHNIQTTVLCN